jgi:hypothetical protein
LQSDAAAVAIALPACVAALALGIHLQGLVHLNHDVGWIAHSAGWLLDGRRFGTDILDPNPPLAWYLMLPAAAVARAGWLHEVEAVRLWTWVLTIAAIALTGWALKLLARSAGRPEALALLVTLAAVMALLPVGNFGQRELLAFAVLQPYVCMVCLRLAGQPEPAAALPVLAGVAAGIGICLKPFLLAVPVLVELLVLVLTRRIRGVFRSETLAMGSVMGAYAVAILLFARDYLEFALPLIRAVYWAYDDAGYLIGLRFREAVTPAVWGVGIALASFSFTRVHAVLLAAVAGFSASYWLQGKGFPYHAFPVLGVSCLLLAYSGVRATRALAGSARLARLHLRLLALIVLPVAVLPPLLQPFSEALRWYDYGDLHQGTFGMLRQEPIDRLRRLGVRGTDYIYALSTHPNPGFPAVNYLGVRWAGRSVSQFAIPAHVRRSEVSDPKLLAAIDRATRLQVTQVVEDLEAHRPRFVMVEARQRRLGLAYRPFDDLAFYGADARFAAAWRCYEEIEPMQHLRLFRRREGC